MAPGRDRGFSRDAKEDTKTRIHKIVTDKSTLRLALLGRTNWIKKELRAHCYFCERKFGAFSRKHHCRACGDVVCSNCNRRRDVQVGASPDDLVHVRLCFDCIDKSLIASAVQMIENSLEHSHSGVVDSFVMDKYPDAIKSGSTATSSASSSLEWAMPEAIETSAIQDGYESEDAASGNEDDDEEDQDTMGVGSWRSHTSAHALGLLLEEDEDLDVNEDEVSRAISSLAMDDAEATRRREVLAAFHIRESERQLEFDALCELAGRALDSAVAAVAFMEDSVQWFKAKVGISPCELPRGVAFCSQLLSAAPDATVVADASQDTRFASNPLVTGSAHIRFYASTPIRDPASRIVIGSVFVMDPSPKRVPPARVMEVLAYLSSAAERLLMLCQRDRAERRVRRLRSEPSIPGTGAIHSNECPGKELEGSPLHRAHSMVQQRRSASRTGATLLDPSLGLSTPSSGTRTRWSSPGPQTRAPASSRASYPTDASTGTDTDADAAAASGMYKALMKQITDTQQLLAPYGSRADAHRLAAHDEPL